jgi:hypothetical protein
MRSSFCIGSVILSAFSGMGSFAQTPVQKPVNPAVLELTAETAATTDEGHPAALRVTAKNIGSVTVTMPMLGGSCSPDNGVALQSFWVSIDERRGSGGGGACGISDQPPLSERVRKQWIRLRPGEYMTTMIRLTEAQYDAGTVEYWVEYTPPDATAQEIKQLMQDGFVIPTEKIATEHRRFQVP